MILSIKDNNKKKSYVCNATKAAKIIGVSRSQIYKWAKECNECGLLTYYHLQFDITFNTEIIKNESRNGFFTKNK